MCYSKKLKFLKEQKARVLISKMTGIKVPILSNLSIGSILVAKYKTLLAWDTFMPEMHLSQPGFTYSACRPFTKKKERIKKLKEPGNSRYIKKIKQSR